MSSYSCCCALRDGLDGVFAGLNIGDAGMLVLFRQTRSDAGLATIILQPYCFDVADSQHCPLKSRKRTDTAGAANEAHTQGTDTVGAFDQSAFSLMLHRYDETLTTIN